MHCPIDTICDEKALSLIVSSTTAMRLSFKNAMQSLVPSAYLLTPSMSETSSLDAPELVDLYKQKVEALLEDYKFMYNQVSGSE